MKIAARKTFTHDQLGTLAAGVPVEASDAIGQYLIDQGHCTAVTDEDAPKKAPGKRKPADA